MFASNMAKSTCRPAKFFIGALVLSVAGSKDGARREGTAHGLDASLLPYLSLVAPFIPTTELTVGASLRVVIEFCEASTIIFKRKGRPARGKHFRNVNHLCILYKIPSRDAPTCCCPLRSEAERVLLQFCRLFFSALVALRMPGFRRIPKRRTPPTTMNETRGRRCLVQVPSPSPHLCSNQHTRVIQSSPCEVLDHPEHPRSRRARESAREKVVATVTDEPFDAVVERVAPSGDGAAAQIRVGNNVGRAAAAGNRPE